MNVISTKLFGQKIVLDGNIEARYKEFVSSMKVKVGVEVRVTLELLFPRSM